MFIREKQTYSLFILKKPIGQQSICSERKFFILIVLSCTLSLIWWFNMVTEYDGIVGEKINQVISSNFISDGKINYTNNKKYIRNNKNSENVVVILMWTKHYDKEGEALEKLLAIPEEYDPNCYEGAEMTINRSRIEEADAIIFFHRAYDFKVNDAPKYRRADQLWVLYLLESPAFSYDLRSFNNLFNWTMSYRRDSEIWAPYGSYFPKKSATTNNSVIESENNIKGQNLTEWISGKTNLMVAAVSHCCTPGKRENYLNILRYEGNISVDIFGLCGVPMCLYNNPKCNHTAIWDDLARKYKFYFAAENALCTEYITEKFWRTLQFGMVPVVYGNGNYSAVAPPGSFIDTKDFSSPKELANYLKKLDEDPDEYRKYFEWQKKYTVVSDETWLGMCRLCKAVKDFRRKLDQDPSQLPKLSHVYRDVSTWWLLAPRLFDRKFFGIEKACTDKGKVY